MAIDAKRLRDAEYFLTTLIRLEPSNKLMVLQPWQKEVLPKFFERDIAGKLVYTLHLISLVKKSGKSSFLGALAVHHLFTVPNALILLVSNSKEQAEVLIYRVMKYAIEHNRYLRDSCRMIGKNKIILKNGSEARVVSSKAASNAGPSMSLTIFDELWAAPEKVEELFTELSAIPSRESSIWIASYAGPRTDSLLYRLYELGESGDDPRFHCYWSHDPQPSVWISDEYLQSQESRLLPSSFRRLHHNEWGSPLNPYLTAEDWAACFDSGLLPLFPGDKSVAMRVGIDVAVKRDSVGICGIYRDVDDDKVRLGFVKVFDPPGQGKEIDLESTVVETLRWLSNNHFVTKFLYDLRFMQGSIAQRLTGEGLPMEGVSPMPSSISPINEGLRQIVKARRFQHYSDPKLNEHVENCQAVETTQGIMLQSVAPNHPIDAAQALAIAAKDIYKAQQHIIAVHRSKVRPRALPRVPTKSDWANMGRRKGIKSFHELISKVRREERH